MISIELAIFSAALTGFIVFVAMKIREDLLKLEWEERHDKFKRKALAVQKEFIASIREASGLDQL